MHAVQVRSGDCPSVGGNGRAYCNFDRDRSAVLNQAAVSGARSRLSQAAFRLPNRKMDESYQREAKHSDPSDETDFQND